MLAALALAAVAVAQPGWMLREQHLHGQMAVQQLLRLLLLEIVHGTAWQNSQTHVHLTDADICQVSCLVFSYRTLKLHEGKGVP